MNYPMLYWFVPRELVGLAKFLLIAVLVLGVVWVLKGVFSRRLDRRRRIRRAIGFGVVMLPIAVLLVGTHLEEKRRQAEARAYVQAAWAHFKQRCETAHITYFKPVPPQDGVFIMKPGKAVTSVELSDQYWMGDPYDLPDTPENEAWGLLYRKRSMPPGNAWAQRGGLDYVEMAHPDKPGMFRRYSMKWTGTKSQAGDDVPDHRAIRMSPDTFPERLSRYGYTWDDISTQEDRKYWVAGGRMRVVDLEAGEVVAERVGYVIQKYFGATSSTFNQTPWRGAEKCAIRIPAYSGRREFISTALGTWNELKTDGETK